MALGLSLDLLFQQIEPGLRPRVLRVELEHLSEILPGVLETSGVQIGERLVEVVFGRAIVGRLRFGKARGRLLRRAGATQTLVAESTVARRALSGTQDRSGSDETSLRHRWHSHLGALVLGILLRILLAPSAREDEAETERVTASGTAPVLIAQLELALDLPGSLDDDSGHGHRSLGCRSVRRRDSIRQRALPSGGSGRCAKSGGAASRTGAVRIGPGHARSSFRSWREGGRRTRCRRPRGSDLWRRSRHRGSRWPGRRDGRRTLSGWSRCRRK